MSRETYFRAWDTYNEVWADEYLAIAEEGHVIEIKNDGTTEYWKDRFIIEFDTGLKDKNGKEICEGDIVRIDSMDELRVGYVELVADQYCIVCGEEDGHKIVAEFYYYSKPEENCKVIGNIHENPELLDVILK